MSPPPSEFNRSLSQRNYAHGDDEFQEYREDLHRRQVRGALWAVLVILFGVGLGIVFFLQDQFADWGYSGIIPRDPALAARRIMTLAPVIDGHIDLPYAVRVRYANNISAFDLNSRMPGHTDIPRLREGQVGGFFWSVFVGCPNSELAGEDFLGSTWRVRDTLEQIDVARLLIDQYSDTFQLTLGSEQVKAAITQGKIASLLGVEGGHQLGNSIAVLRQYYELGVRYVTLTHACHNAFADSGGILTSFPPLHGGLSDLGYSLIDEMNRLGVLVDLSHTSDDTAKQAFNYSKAPVFWSHSSARSVHNVSRNVPDDILELIGTGNGKKDAVVMVNFAPFFVAPDGKADVKAVANHVDHIAKIAGKKHVGIGSDFDGIGSGPEGLEDVSKYPALVAELYSRGWNKYELAGLTGANFLRVFAGAEQVSKDLQVAGASAVMDYYHKRHDLPKQPIEGMLEL